MLGRGGNGVADLRRRERERKGGTEEVKRRKKAFWGDGFPECKEKRIEGGMLEAEGGKDVGREGKKREKEEECILKEGGDCEFSECTEVREKCLGRGRERDVGEERERLSRRTLAELE